MNTTNRSTNGRAKLHPISHCRQSRRRRAAATGTAAAASPVANKPVPIESASSCIAAQPSSGDVSPTVTCSIWPSIAVATSSHVGIAGGDLASSSCSPNAASSSSSASAGSSHAACTAGRSLTVSYHFACTSGRDAYSTNAQPASLLSACSNTARLPPPTNDVPVSSVGWWATVHVSGSAPASVTSPIIHGPLMNAPTVPSANCASTGTSETDGWASPLSKNES